MNNLFVVWWYRGARVCVSNVERSFYNCENDPILIPTNGSQKHGRSSKGVNGTPERRHHPRFWVGTPGQGDKLNAAFNSIAKKGAGANPHPLLQYNAVGYFLLHCHQKKRKQAYVDLGAKRNNIAPASPMPIIPTPGCTVSNGLRALFACPRDLAASFDFDSSHASTSVQQ